MNNSNIVSIPLAMLLTACSQNIIESQEMSNRDNLEVNSIEEISPDTDIELDNLDGEENEPIIDRSNLEKVNHSYLFRMGIMNCQIIENPESEVFEEYIENNCSKQKKFNE